MKNKITPINVWRKCGCCGDDYVPEDGYGKNYYLCCDCNKVGSEVFEYGKYSIELKDWDFKGDR